MRCSTSIARRICHRNRRLGYSARCRNRDSAVRSAQQGASHRPRPAGWRGETAERWCHRSMSPRETQRPSRRLRVRHGLSDSDRLPRIGYLGRETTCRWLPRASRSGANSAPPICRRILPGGSPPTRTHRAKIRGWRRSCSCRVAGRRSSANGHQGCAAAVPTTKCGSPLVASFRKAAAPAR